MLKAATWVWEETAPAFRPLGKEQQWWLDATSVASDVGKVG
jgi:hypothetical protein